MADTCPSKTAVRVAARRAAHQLLDVPKIFNDPLALRILGLDKPANAAQDQTWLDESPLARILRASLAARSQFAEDSLRDAIEQGVDQYVILGAGLDTFAYRSPYPENALHIFEVDQPGTQEWKRQRLDQAEIPCPKNLVFAPMDFECQTLAQGLLQAGFDASKRAFFSWLGVTMYLTGNAIDNTLRWVASLPAGSGIVFDYMIAPTQLSPEARKVFDGLARRVASIGEPFQTFFDPWLLNIRLQELGFDHIVDMNPVAMDARYCSGRTDGLRVGRLSHVVLARI